MTGHDHRRGRSSRVSRLAALEDEDPLTGFANLFDIAMVFAVALMASAVLYLQVPELMDRSKDVTVVVDPQSAEMEIVTRKSETITRYRVSREKARGDGVRLGTAYRLDSGEVVYVPEAGSAPAAGGGRKD